MMAIPKPHKMSFAWSSPFGMNGGSKREDFFIVWSILTFMCRNQRSEASFSCLFFKLLGRVQTFFHSWAFGQRRPRPNLNFDWFRGWSTIGLADWSDQSACTIFSPCSTFLTQFLTDHWTSTTTWSVSWPIRERGEGGCRKYLVETFEVEGLSLLLEWAHRQPQKVLWAWLKSRATHPPEQQNQARSFSRDWFLFLGAKFLSTGCWTLHWAVIQMCNVSRHSANLTRWFFIIHSKPNTSRKNVQLWCLYVPCANINTIVKSS